MTTMRKVRLQWRKTGGHEVRRDGKLVATVRRAASDREGDNYVVIDHTTGSMTPIGPCASLHELRGMLRAMYGGYAPEPAPPIDLPLAETLARLLAITEGCRDDMHEPDAQGLMATAHGFHLDNACGSDPMTNHGELTVLLSRTTPNGTRSAWFNLADLIALARRAR